MLFPGSSSLQDLVPNIHKRRSRSRRVEIRARLIASNLDDVFVNCPFDEAYDPLFEATVFTLYFCGFRPRCTKELDDGAESRIDKIYRLIGQCRYGIHDISRTDLDDINNLPRFNMPLELGMFLGAKRFGSAENKNKRCLILDVEQYRYQKFISDIGGADIQPHGNDANVLVVTVRNWLSNVSRRAIAGPLDLQRAFADFYAERNDLAAAAGLDPAKIPYADYERLVVGWLTRPAV